MVVVLACTEEEDSSLTLYTQWHCCSHRIHHFVKQKWWLCLHVQRRKTAAKDAYKLTLRCLSTFDDSSPEVWHNTIGCCRYIRFWATFQSFPVNTCCRCCTVFGLWKLATVIRSGGRPFAVIFMHIVLVYSHGCVCYFCNVWCSTCSTNCDVAWLVLLKLALLFDLAYQPPLHWVGTGCAYVIDPAPLYAATSNQKSKQKKKSFLKQKMLLICLSVMRRLLSDASFPAQCKNVQQ